MGGWICYSYGGGLIVGEFTVCGWMVGYVTVMDQGNGSLTVGEVNGGKGQYLVNFHTNRSNFLVKSWLIDSKNSVKQYLEGHHICTIECDVLQEPPSPSPSPRTCG